MSLSRYLPTPSDRMGILWNLLTVKESIVLEYGPAGTTHFSMSLYGELGVEQENQLFTTHMSEDDVVMGDVTRLEDAIVELDEAYHPKVIFVVGSSIASVIGTDIKGVCNYMQERVQARLVCFDQGGFRGDYSLGCQAVWSLLAQEFPKVGDVQENVYNLVGVSAGSYRMRSDVWEIQNLMSEAFHMTLGTSFCVDTSVAGAGGKRAAESGTPGGSQRGSGDSGASLRHALGLRNALWLSGHAGLAPGDRNSPGPGAGTPCDQPTERESDEIGHVSDV